MFSDSRISEQELGFMESEWVQLRSDYEAEIKQLKEDMTSVTRAIEAANDDMLQLSVYRRE
jgi:hypothetical protein